MGNTAVYAIKIAIIVAAVVGIVAAANVVITGITAFGTSSALGEIIGLISIYLPFNSGTVMGSLLTSMTALLSFVIAKKIYELSISAQESA